MSVRGRHAAVLLLAAVVASSSTACSSDVFPPRKCQTPAFVAGGAHSDWTEARLTYTVVKSVSATGLEGEQYEGRAEFLPSLAPDGTLLLRLRFYSMQGPWLGRSDYYGVGPVRWEDTEFREHGDILGVYGVLTLRSNGIDVDRNRPRPFTGELALADGEEIRAVTIDFAEGGGCSLDPDAPPPKELAPTYCGQAGSLPLTRGGNWSALPAAALGIEYTASTLHPDAVGRRYLVYPAAGVWTFSDADRGPMVGTTLGALPLFELSGCPTYVAAGQLGPEPLFFACEEGPMFGSLWLQLSETSGNGYPDLIEGGYETPDATEVMRFTIEGRTGQACVIDPERE